MSVKITTNQNTVTVADADKSITIINNREPNRLEVIQPESNVIYVATPGPQGPQGPAGTGGGGSSDLTALNSFSASMLTFTGSIQTQVNNLTAATSSYILASVTSSMIVSGALTASHYLETDPIFVAKSASFATTGSNTFIGNQIVTGSLFTTGSNVLVGNTILSGTLQVQGEYPPSVGSASVSIVGNVDLNGYLRFDPVNSNIDTLASASYIYVSGSTNDLYFSQNGDGYSNTTRLRWLEGNIYTGLLTGGVVSGSIGGTTFNVSSGSGIIVTLNATTASREPYPTIKYVTWPSFANITPTFLNIQDTTWLGIDSNGNLIQQANSFYNGQFDDSLQIGSVIHPNLSTISLFKTFTVTSYGIAQQTYEFIRSFGAIKVSGHTISPSGSSMSVNRDSGIAFALGRNYVNDADKPSLVSDASYLAPNIFRYYKSGSVFKTSTGTTTIDPTQYNTPNTSTGLSPTPGGQYTIQRLFYFPNQQNTLGVYYGRTTYNSIINALSNLPYETFEENNNTLTQAIFVAYLIVKGGTSNLSNTSDAQFIQAGTFRNTTSGGGGAASIALDDLSDVVISGVQHGDLLVHDGSEWINSKQLTGSYGLTGSLSFDNGGVTGSLLGTASWAESASQALTASFVTGAVLQGGNSFGSTMVIGTNDAQNLTFETNGINRITINNSGSINIGTSTSINNNTILRLSKPTPMSESVASIVGLLVDPAVPASASTQTSLTSYGISNQLNAAPNALVSSHIYFRANQGATWSQTSKTTGAHVGLQILSLDRGLVNYGIDSRLIESKSGVTHRNFNLHAQGGAPNYFSGSIFVGHQSVNGNFDPTAKLHVKGDKLTANQTVFLVEDSTATAKGRTLLQITNDHTSSFGTHLIPVSLTGTTSSYDLGTPSAAWRSLYVANGSIYFITGGEVSSSLSSSYTTTIDPETGQEVVTEITTATTTVLAAPTSASMKVTPSGMFTFDGPVAIISGSVSASIEVNPSGSIVFGAPIIIPSGSNAVTFPYSGSAVITGSLVVNDGTYDIVDTVNKTLKDSNGVSSIEWSGRRMKDTGGSSAIDWESKALNDGASNTSIDWESRFLYDKDANPSVDWQSRVFYANDGATPHIDWNDPSYMRFSSTTESPISYVLGTDGSGRVFITASSAFGGGGGSTTPGGSNTQIQYNNNNAFGGVPTLTYSGSLLRATGSFSGSFTGNLTGTASVASSVTNLSQSLNLTGSFNIRTLGSEQPTISGTAGGFTSTLVLGKYPTLTAPEGGGIALQGPSTSISSSGNIRLVARNGQSILDLDAGGYSFDPLLMRSDIIWLSASSGITASGHFVPGDPITSNTSSYDLGSPTRAWRDLYVSNGSINFISGSTSASIQLSVDGTIAFTGAGVSLPSGSLTATASYAETASFLLGSVTSASYAATASYIGNGVSFVSSGSIITGSTAISSSYGLLIPANTFAVGDMVRVHGVFTKPIAGTSTAFYIYVNTSNTLSGATQLALFNTTSNRWIPMTRTLSIESSTSTTLHTTTLSAYNDEIATNTAAVRASVNINWGVNQYILFAAQNATLADRTDTFRFYAKKI